MRLFQEQLKSKLPFVNGLMNHMRTMALSEELLKDAATRIHAPTVIFHGSVDPIFPLDHGESLSKSISGSKLVVCKGMGHVLNSHFDSVVIKEIKNLALSQ